MINNTFCIGNGESRKGFDLTKLKPYGKIYGCNSLYKDFTPDYLISVDPPITRHILSEIRPFNYIYVNRIKDVNYQKIKIRYKNSKNERVIQPTLGWAAGPTALHFCCEFEKPDNVYMLGFDLYSDNGLQNNVYKNTPFYATFDKKMVNPMEWVRQMSFVYRSGSFTMFWRVGRASDELPSLWRGIGNIKFISYEEMWDRLYGKK